MSIRIPSFLLATIITTGLMAQISVGGSPYSEIHALSEENIPQVVLPSLDMKAVDSEDLVREQSGKNPAYGRIMDVDMDLRTMGNWVQLSDGSEVMRMKITAQDAKGIELFFDDLFIPPGAVMYIYDESKEQMLGGFTTFNNHESGSFTAAMITGESCIIEYFEPQTQSGEGRLHINGVGHAYRMVAGSGEKADDCQVDVNCSPEGDGWHAQRDGVVRISVRVGSSLFWCSGSVVNNTNWDCTPYVLSAWHCADASSTSDFNNYKFYFRYQRTGCASGVALVSKVMTGCDKISDSAISSSNQGSDFVLFLLDNPIPDSFIPFFAGWDITGVPSGSGVCIHQPSGDEKKISTYSVTTQNATWSGAPSNFHWRVFWSGTTNGHGVTEGGSSGSPIYTEAGHIMGTLTGGASFCNSVQPGGQFLPDFYGKMSRHWEDNGSTSNRQLKPWLDPGNTGITILDGSYDPCGNYTLYTGVEEIETEIQLVFPNPTMGSLTIESQDIQMDRLLVRDASGRILIADTPDNVGSTYTMDVSGLSNGIYFLETFSNGITLARTKFLKQ